MPISFPAIPPLFALIVLLAAARPAVAETLPRPEQIASPRERPVLRRLYAAVTRTRRAGSPLAELDRMLAEAVGPTPLRGYIQHLRAYELFNRDRDREAGAAIEESIRLLPDYTGPLLLGASIEAFNDRPAIAADYLLRAIALAPADARDIGDFELDNLVTRLMQHHEDRRLELLAQGLFGIGWRGDDLVLRSTLAWNLIRGRVAAGDLAGARAVLPHLAVPDHARQLLIINDYRALWPDIEAWTGPRQERQWAIYLRETRARWQASRDPVRASPYVRALSRAGHFRTVVQEMLPVLMRRPGRQRDYDQVWAFSPVAGALAQLGRWNEIEALFAHGLQTWRLGADANALNLTANRARFRLYRGDSAGALRDIDATLADVPRWGGAVSPAPLAGMHFVRACALHRLGRDGEALSSAAIARQAGSLDTAIDLLLCLDRQEEAREVLFDGLELDRVREEVVDFVQIDDVPPVPSDFARAMEARRQGLRSDPALREAVERHGRILPYSATAGAPAEAPGR